MEGLKDGEDEGCGGNKAVKDAHPRETGLNILTSVTVKCSTSGLIINMGFSFTSIHPAQFNKTVTPLGPCEPRVNRAHISLSLCG